MGKKHGYGVYEDKARNNRYVGDWDNGKKQGKGVFTQGENEQLKYDGQYWEDKKHGSGILRQNASNSIYKGGFENDFKHGNSMELFISNGEQFRVGVWQAGRFDCGWERGLDKKDTDIVHIEKGVAVDELDHDLLLFPDLSFP